MNEKIFIDKFIKAYLAISTQKDRTALLKSLKDYFKTVHAIAEFLVETKYEFVNNIRDTFYSSLTDEEKLEWALLT